MNRAQSINQIKSYISYIRNQKKGFITNFYLNEVKHAFWIEDGVLLVHETPECIFLLKENEDFFNLFFIATTANALQKAITTLPLSESLFTVDVVGAKDNPIKDSLLEIGFHQYETIYRMSRIGQPIDCEFDDGVQEANVDDVAIVKALLDKHFNALSEQICCKKELAHFVTNHCLLVYKNGGNINGFIIYEIQGVTLYLRYWWVDPSCRNKGIGAKLYHSFFNRGRTTKRQIHWLIESNENARVRYEHYGYTAENLYDYVLTNRKP